MFVYLCQCFVIVVVQLAGNFEARKVAQGIDQYSCRQEHQIKGSALIGIALYKPLAICSHNRFGVCARTFDSFRVQIVYACLSNTIKHNSQAVCFTSAILMPPTSCFPRTFVFLNGCISAVCERTWTPFAQTGDILLVATEHSVFGKPCKWGTSEYKLFVICTYWYIKTLHILCTTTDFFDTHLILQEQ